MTALAIRQVLELNVVGLILCCREAVKRCLQLMGVQAAILSMWAQQPKTRWSK